MKKLLILLIIGSTFLTSCNDMEEKVIGHWVIKEFDGSHPILTSGLGIKENYTCVLPLTNVNDRHTNKENGKWEVIKKGEDNYLNITTDNELFNDSYRIKVWERVLDENSQAYGIRMILESDRTTIVLTKSDF
jgi:hypothetical protein